MGDGEVRATFRWRGQMAGAHAGRRDQNEHGIGICLIGNFETTPPTPKQLAALTDLLKNLSTRYAITRTHVLRHQDVRSTLCPGRLFPWEQMLATVPVEAAAEEHVPEGHDS
jgi:N-acetyl-anhydromuramyl-L-alanine amidase AmpD